MGANNRSVNYRNAIYSGANYRGANYRGANYMSANLEYNLKYYSKYCALILSDMTFALKMMKWFSFLGRARPQ